MVSTMMRRLRPPVFYPASYPLVEAGEPCRLPSRSGRRGIQRSVLVAPGLLAHHVAQLVVERVEGAVVTPASEPPVDGLSRREVLGELTPRTTGANDVEHRVHRLAFRVNPKRGRGSHH